MTTLLSRRTMLQGAGVAIGLPLLDAMLPPAQGAQSTAAAPMAGRSPLRAVWMFEPNGLSERYFWPTYITPLQSDSDIVKEGITKRGGPPAGEKLQRFDLKEMPHTLAPLVPFKQRITLIGGLDMGDCKNHVGTAPHTLNCRNGRYKDSFGVNSGITIDQVLAREFGHHTPVPSLQLYTGTDNGIPYQQYISFRKAAQPAGQLQRPRAAFEFLFGNPQQDALKRSILDSVREQSKRLQSELGAADRRKVDEYLQSIRETEKRIQQLEQVTRQRGRPQLDIPDDIPEDRLAYMEIMTDIVVHALSADMTRWVTWILNHEGGNPKSILYPGEYDKPLNHHGLSHKDPENLVRFIDLYYMKRYARLLKKLQATPDGDGTLLDHTYVCNVRGMNNGSHNDNNTSQIVAGGPKLPAPAQAIVYPKGTLQYRLWLGMLEQLRFDPNRIEGTDGQSALKEPFV